MMEWVRKHVSWIAGAAVAGFVLWMIGTAVSLQSTRAQSVGTLFGKSVSLQDYAQALEAVTHQAILQYGDEYQKQYPKEVLERRAWERLMLVTKAKKERIRISDDEVREELLRFPIFKSDIGFDTRAYEAIVRYSLGTTPRIFEEEIRDSLKITKLVQENIPEPTATDGELLEAFKNGETQIQLKYIAFSDQGAAQEAADRLNSTPESFGQVAQENELDAVSTELFKRKTNLPDLGPAESVFSSAFDASTGDIVGPIPSTQGWLVAQIDQKIVPETTTFEDQKDKIEQQVLSQKRVKAYLTWYQDLLDQANLKKKLASRTESP